MNPRIGLWVALACVHVFISAGIADTANAASSSEKTTISERVEKVRETLLEKVQQVSSSSDDDVKVAGYHWDNWENWENWGNWENWENWENWGNWGNWENWSNYC